MKLPTLILVILTLILSVIPVLAQTGNGIISPPNNELEQQLREEIGCICGTCGNEALTSCTCETADKMRSDLKAQINLKRNKEEIISYLTTQYGGEHFLRSPIDKGFNRLAWFLPYFIAALGLIFIGTATKRWTNSNKKSSTPQPEDPTILKRLNDELRDLD